MPRPSPVKTGANQLGVPVAEFDDLQNALGRLERLKPDLGIVIAYGRLIPSTLLRLAPHGLLGLHPSLLPKYRGASPVAWAILNGEAVTGETVFRLNERLDAGDVLLQRAVPLEPRTTAIALADQLAQLGAELLLDAIERVEQGQAHFHPQDETQATYAPKLTKAHGQIDWQAQAAVIDRLVRGTTPWPGAYTVWRAQLLKVWETSYNAQHHNRQGQPGKLLAASADGLVVSTGSGTLTIQELQVAGGRRMTVREFLAGHDMRVGEILGRES